MPMRLVFEEEFDSETALDLQDTKNPGFSFYRARPFGWPPAAMDGISIEGGILTLQEAVSYANLQISTIAGRDDNGSWTGFFADFENGGFYFEAAIAFDPFYLDNNPDTEGCPAFWAMSAEHLYPYESPPYELFENDFMEYNPSWINGRKDCYFHALHHWQVPASGANEITSYPAPVIDVPEQTDWNSFNVFGVLWMPGQAIESYLNGELTRSVSFDDFPHMSTGDQHHFPVILGSGQWPMRVDWVRVWQYDSSMVATAIHPPFAAPVSRRQPDFIADLLGRQIDLKASSRCGAYITVRTVPGAAPGICTFMKGW
jgi:hypothetical protein